MADISALPVFAQNGEKNTTGLNQADGFPAALKPARQWFNYLFNAVTTKINELAVAVNEINNAPEDTSLSDHVNNPDPHTQYAKESDFALNTGGGLSGYQKLPNGLTLQWGRELLLAGDTDDIRFEFPTAFTDNCFNLQTSVYQQDSHFAGDGAFHVKSIDRQGANVNLQVYNSETGVSHIDGFYWFAIGV